MGGSAGIREEETLEGGGMFRDQSAVPDRIVRRRS
jgi:hypothetical protein